MDITIVWHFPPHPANLVIWSWFVLTAVISWVAYAFNWRWFPCGMRWFYTGIAVVWIIAVGFIGG